MANISRNFLMGRMNKVIDERVLPEGEYVDAMNVRMGSTENAEVGVIENTKGNTPLTSLAYIDGTPLSPNARCIGAIEDSANETLYWFVHDPTFSVGVTNKLDLIASFNVLTTILTYHIISINDGGNINTTLNFNPKYLITGVNIIQDLLFFTDNYNEPRFININSNYPNPVLNVDELDPESILVIKRPPIESPTIRPITTSGQENFLETRFICFAYRYRYADGEYSATSQWSAPAFVPNPFEFSPTSMLNEGMTNFTNSVIVEYNSGGHLVVGIDLLFKQSENNIIKVIEKLDKTDLGLANNALYEFTFNNSKIFTVLNDAEILRLFDNVPLLAKAQTIMGNRLMYGNYVEGYDLIDKLGNPVKIEYETSLIAEDIGNNVLTDTTQNGIYNIDPTAIGLSVSDSVFTVDFTGIELNEGSLISIDLQISHKQWTGYTPSPDEVSEDINLSFSFLLTTSYSSVYEMATSPEFINAIGTPSNILPVSTTVLGQDTSCNGNTFTDSFNCQLPNTLGGSPNNFTKYESGISGLNTNLQPIKIITTPSSSVLGFQLLAMAYVDDIALPTKIAYEYYEAIFVSALFQEIANPRSLHSNRGYEVGIVYMDGFNRATTALVSAYNAEYVPCGFSINKNSIRVNIPVTQRAPRWAKRYRFVIKPDEERYETIYSNLFFINPETNEAWLFLEGENMRKVEEGDRLIVKSDSQGPTLNCVRTTVLEKVSQPSNFIEIPLEGTPTTYLDIPAGLYIKLNPNNFNLTREENSIIAPGQRRRVGSSGQSTILFYPMNVPNPLDPGMFIDYTVPAGSRIQLSIDWNRAGTGKLCEKRGYLLEKTYISTAEYENMYDWFVGDNIKLTINTGIDKGGNQVNVFVPGLDATPAPEPSNIYFSFFRDLNTNALSLRLTTTNSCRGGNFKYSRSIYVAATITVFRADSLVVLETEPLDALPDVFFENELSFPIDSEGNHGGNVQNQDIINGEPAIVDTGFFNCYSFGNGVESYKIRDSIVGRSFTFGERVTAVAEQDYKEAHRFSDITYSGIYNGESNINRLNQFNSGLLNFKHCEISFGPISLLDGRSTDILVLQEDKISYVLSGKNLLSDSSAGGVITATPEVLGTQIARPEKYGISFNPESYVQWGSDRFFTDAKRGVVIQLKGGETGNQELQVISQLNMRTFFRDSFNETINSQKLGGFDPYMNEYVLSINKESLPDNSQCINCGISQTFTLSKNNEDLKSFTYCVNLGAVVGLTGINWMFLSLEPGAEVNISVLYNGVNTDSGFTGLGGNLSFDKDNVSIDFAEITIQYSGDMDISIVVGCVDSPPMTIVEVVLTNNYQAGETIHTQYRYNDGAFVGPLFSNLVLFDTGVTIPLVSRYNTVSGFVGSGGFPPESSTMRLSTNVISPDNFVFDPLVDKFRYFRGTTLFNNTDLDIQALLLVSLQASPNLGLAPSYYADFIVPPNADGEFLYLIWDLRDSVLTNLCFGDTRIDTCCNCQLGDYYLNSSFTTATSIFDDNNLTQVSSNGFYSENGIVRELIDGILLPQQPCQPCSVEVSLCFGTTSVDVCCACDEQCISSYNTYSISNNSANTQVVGFYDENGIYNEISIGSNQSQDICSVGAPTSSNQEVIILFVSCGCITP